MEWVSVEESVCWAEERLLAESGCVYVIANEPDRVFGVSREVVWFNLCISRILAMRCRVIYIQCAGQVQCEMLLIWACWLLRLFWTKYLDILLLNFTSKHVFMTQQKYFVFFTRMIAIRPLQTAVNLLINVTERCSVTLTHTYWEKQFSKNSLC